jgi:hypothetical protein
VRYNRSRLLAVKGVNSTVGVALGVILGARLTPLSPPGLSVDASASIVPWALAACRLSISTSTNNIALLICRLWCRARAIKEQFVHRRCLIRVVSREFRFSLLCARMMSSGDDGPSRNIGFVTSAHAGMPSERNIRQSAGFRILPDRGGRSADRRLVINRSRRSRAGSCFSSAVFLIGSA